MITFKGKGSRGSVGLDLDGAYLAAVEIADGKLARAMSADLPPGLIADGEVANPEGLAEALRAFARRHDLSRRVRLGVGNRQVAVRAMELPRIENERELAAAVRFQASDAIAMPVDEVVLDHRLVGEFTGSDGIPRMRVIVVAARESMVMRVAGAARRAGLRPEGIDLNAFALVRALAPQDGADRARVYCHLGEVTNLAVAAGSSCSFTRALTGGRDDRGQVEPRALAEEIRLSIDFYKAQPEAVPVSDVVLSGPGATGDDVSEGLATAIGLPTSLAEPLPNVAGEPPDGADARRYTVAAGLAMGAHA